MAFKTWLKLNVSLALVVAYSKIYLEIALNQIDAIVTRNPRDFPVKTPRIVTPNQLIQELTNSP
ncbi:hypothetical protein [Microcoleus sp.]|uniref:hypothetical protein n=1 Tax=Microcoleus sp. TaxID=44472 RepID=UPI0035947FB2